MIGNKAKRILFISGMLFLVIFFLIAAGVASFIWMMLPRQNGTIAITGLTNTVSVESDSFGIPTIKASSKKDAMKTLGYLTARDRLFQMDLLRRVAAGRLSEVIGPATLSKDIEQRRFGYETRAQQAIEVMPADQREMLVAYCEGVNAYLERMKLPPVEFLLLGYRPESWRPQDSILVIMNMHQDLSYREDDERMLTVMEKALPPEVTRFLTPDSDEYSSVLLAGDQSHRPIQKVPVAALKKILDRLPHTKTDRYTFGSVLTDKVLGSNNWVVNGSRTSNGKPILANDMHLTLGVPNIWYRASLEYENLRISGIVLPGVPGIVVGSTSKLAWGFTNVTGDFLDLVMLEVNPENPNEYRTPSGWKSFEQREETIRLKGGGHEKVLIKRTIWGPVSPQKLMGKEVAMHWTALEPPTMNLNLMDLDRIETVHEGIRHFKEFDAPPQNVVMADDKGNIGWTLCGSIPRRKNFDGSVSVSWASGDAGWNGYLTPDEKPHLINPTNGIIATANNRTVGAEYPHLIGLNFSGGYRAHRIYEMLNTSGKKDVPEHLNFQLDTRADFYDFYREVALSVLTEKFVQSQPALKTLGENLKDWDGRAEADNQVMQFLVVFRNKLASNILLPIVHDCFELEPNFKFSWFNLETPLRQLLRARDPDTLPRDPENHSWQEFMGKILKESIENVESHAPVGVPDSQRLAWGNFNRTHLMHPLGRAVPLLARLFNMKEYPMPGSAHSVRYFSNDASASQRMVVSPGDEANSFMHMPCGQSGIPFSRNYRDQHSYWVKGRRMSFLPGKTKHKMKFVPEHIIAGCISK